MYTRLRLQIQHLYNTLFNYSCKQSVFSNSQSSLQSIGAVSFEVLRQNVQNLFSSKIHFLVVKGLTVWWNMKLFCIASIFSYEFLCVAHSCLEEYTIVSIMQVDTNVNIQRVKSLHRMSSTVSKVQTSHCAHSTFLQHQSKLQIFR